MDMKIRDLEQALNVPKETLSQWLVDGSIPSYRLNADNCFGFDEIDSWIMQSSSSGSLLDQKKTVQQRCDFSLYRAIHHGDLFLEKGGCDKTYLIQKASQEISQKMGCDPSVLAEVLLAREKLAPTALNHGVAAPHAHDFVTPHPFDQAFLFFLEEPIDFGAPDGQLVELLFFFFACSNKRHLQLLAKISQVCQSGLLNAYKRKMPSKATLLAQLKNWEIERTIGKNNL